jgi:cell pole-organizing protein PopZ
LLSPATDAQLATSFGALNTTMMLQESGVIEDGVKEMLRPMLKQWLDDNLPGIVERLVRQEIERVARGRR